MVCATVVIGPAGVGKSTMAHCLQEHGKVTKRSIAIFNLDPAADYLPYEPDVDIRELITIEDAMSEFNFGPNGGLVYCMEYLASHMSWLEGKLNEFGPEDTVLLDCPGQLELYTHVPVMPKVCKALANWGHYVCCAYLMDAVALGDGSKFVAGSLAGLAAMLQLPLPRLTVLSKKDLVDDEVLETFLDLNSVTEFFERHEAAYRTVGKQTNPSYAQLQTAIARVVDDHAMLNFVPFSAKDEDSAGHVLCFVDNLTQYDDHKEVHIPNDADYRDDMDNPFSDLVEQLQQRDPQSYAQAASAVYGPGTLGDSSYSM